jgi:hypothetical protein
MGTCCCCVKLVSAGVNPPIGHLSASDSQTSQDSTEQSSSTQSTEAKPEPKSETEEEKRKKKDKKKSDHAGSFVIAPLPIVSPALGAGIVPIAGYITPIPARDRKVEPSVVGAGGLITNNGSRGFGLGGDL